MLNQVMLVGRLVNDIQLGERDNKKYATITLAVPRSYKNENGEYETDFIDCVLWSGVAQNTVEYCRKGDLLGIKGRLVTNTYETESGEKRKSTQIMAEKVTFLSSKKESESNE